MATVLVTIYEGTVYVQSALFMHTIHHSPPKMTEGFVCGFNDSNACIDMIEPIRAKVEGHGNVGEICIETT